MFRVLRCLTAGESHGVSLTAILEGLPAGISVDVPHIQKRMAERQMGFGRSGRQKFEQDLVQLLSGVYQNQTTGAPITFQIANVDQTLLQEKPAVTVPRPGHADLPGAMKYGFTDCTPVAERASARETACRVAMGAMAELFLKEFHVQVEGAVLQIGTAETEEKIREAIVAAAKEGETLGGLFRVTVKGLPPGLGGFVNWFDRLDARLAAAMLSIPAIKGFEIGIGFSAAEKKGSEVHDIIGPGFRRETNRAGGMEGGMTNGEPVWFTCAMKPLPTLREPLDSVDLRTGERQKAPVSRADVTAVSAACVVAQMMTTLMIADALLEKFGGNSLKETQRNYDGYLKQLRV